ncbi:twin-arginine translocase subunit TatC [Phycisphaerales bacterium AB-hyl4]|uniref:Sec-independent protein translocase protein TatC n=1 Tax=Natronomicrosphaera hydrolytica TaxID=3242702 RepID=A0ABV4UAZ7_9BACT
MPMDQPTSAAQQLGDDLRMSFGEHIEELRRRMIHAIAGVVVAAAVTFWFGFQIIAWLARPFIEALDALGFPAQIYVRDPTLGFGVYIKVSLIAAAIVASPWVIYQIWRFISDGLYPHEKRTAYLLAPFSTIMTVAAVMFTYHILLPVSLVFLINFATFYPEVEPGQPGFMVRVLTGATPAPVVDPDAPAQSAEPVVEGLFDRLSVYDIDPASPEEGQLWVNRHERRIKLHLDGQTQVISIGSRRMVDALPELSEYVKFAAMIGLGVVIAFQLPVFMLVVGWTGLIDPNVIARFRKYALFACFALAAMLTPTDFLSMFVLALPLYALFEFGLALMRLTDRRARMANMDDEHP